jgi:hypothetical protein
VATVRSIVGYDIPLAADHFGHIALDSCIRLGQALEPFTLAWLEDMIPWQYTDQWRQLTMAIATPTCTGEDIYLKENFRPLLEQGAVRIVHPDPATSGGIMETKKIGDLAEEHGVAMALHMAATPIATLASVHIAAATQNFLALEHHAADVARWSELVTGLPQPLVEDGYITVPDRPGLGFGDINEDLFREHLDPADPVLFESTAAWDSESSHDRLWSLAPRLSPARTGVSCLECQHALRPPRDGSLNERARRPKAASGRSLRAGGGRTLSIRAPGAGQDPDRPAPPRRAQRPGHGHPRLRIRGVSARGL